MKMAVFQWFWCFVGSPPFGASSWPLAGLLLASGFLLASYWRLAGVLLACCWLLAGLLLASCWPLAGLLLASSWPLAGFKLPHEVENRFLGRLAKTVNSLHEIAVFQWFRCFVGSPPFKASYWPLAGLLLASCWLLAGVVGLLPASCWPLAGLLLASSWPLAGFLLASSFLTRISLENRFLGRLAKTVNSLYENGCFSMVSVFRGVPPIWGLFLASCWLLPGLLLASSWPFAGLLLAFCWRLAGLLLASCWPLAGLLLASCWPLAGVLLASSWPLAGFLLASGLLLASYWPLAGFLLASSFPTRISLENRFLGRLAKTVNSIHENGCFSMVSVFRGVPPI